MATGVLVVFGVVFGLVLVGTGLHRAATRNYRDRSGVVRQGREAVRAGLLVALIGLCELALTLFLAAAG